MSMICLCHTCKVLSLSINEQYNFGFAQVSLASLNTKSKYISCQIRKRVIIPHIKVVSAAISRMQLRIGHWSGTYPAIYIHITRETCTWLIFKSQFKMYRISRKNLFLWTFFLRRVLKLLWNDVSAFGIAPTARVHISFAQKK